MIFKIYITLAIDITPLVTLKKALYPILLDLRKAFLCESFIKIN